MWEDHQYIIIEFLFYFFLKESILSCLQFSSVTQSCSTLCDPMNRSTPGLPVHPPTPRVHWDSRPSSQWCHPAISSSVVPFSSCPQSLPACCLSGIINLNIGNITHTLIAYHTLCCKHFTYFFVTSPLPAWCCVLQFSSVAQ